MSQEVYDFAGWATKSDIVCADGRVIKQDAFKKNDDTTVPLVFEHGWRDPKNIIGRVKLQNRDEGVYAFGYFNDTANGQHAKASVKHGDIVAMSIGAHKIQQSGTDVLHGEIFEISLVGKGANPGALIEEVISHSDTGEEIDTGKIVVYSDNIIHSIDSVLEPVEFQTKGETIEMAEKTIGDVLKTLDEEQMLAVETLVGSIIDMEDEEDEGDGNVKHNAFDKTEDKVIYHNIAGFQNDVNSAIDRMSGSLKGLMVQHGIENMELLFPEAKNLNETPYVYSDINTSTDQIISGVTKSPWAKIRSTWADFTAEEARAQGYVTGDQKIEQVFAIAKRETSPQTIYKLQKMDRDNILDMKRTLDIVPFLNKEMRMMLNQEIARATLVGDGRPYLDTNGEPNRHKIDESHIRPIRSDDDFYTIKKTYNDASTFVETVIKSYGEYRGSGRPTLFINPDLLADIQLLKGTDGRWLNMTGIPSLTELAAQLRVREIVETTFLAYGEAIIVNLTDYQYGTDKGGEITTFDDFDIDFNKYTYLIETRLSGALVRPKSAIYISQGEVIPVTKITPSKASTTLEVGAQETITLTFAPTNATNQNVSWASLDHNVATVNAGGQITARGEGETSIKVVSPENGINATILVTVTAAE